MQSKVTHISDTKVKITVIGGQKEISSTKEHALKHLAKDVKLAGFREGKAPLNIIEKNIDPTVLQNHFLEDAVQGMYSLAVQEHQLKLAGRPNVTITKFVPFSDLEFDVEVEVIGEVKVPDYKKIKKSVPEAKVTADEVNKVLANVALQRADKVEVDRAAKEGDELIIDFTGTDDKGKPISGADGKDYPLLLGSKTFIPGFEENLYDLKPSEEKTFTLTFPKDYGVKALANKKVKFEVKVSKVQEVKQPKIDDAFAAQVGPFKTVQELKDDIKKQLQHDKKHEVERAFESELVKEITDKSKLSLPQSLIDEQSERLINEIKQNLIYRGQTWQELLDAEGKTEEQYIESDVKPEAVARVKGGLVLSEIADLEKLTVTPEELEGRIQALKLQYKDQAMQLELDKPESRQDIAGRILTEKTLSKLKEYATQKK